MSDATIWRIELFPWYAIAVYWAISSLRVKRTQKTESSETRLMTIAFMLIAFVLLFSQRFGFGPLGLRFVPRNLGVQILGILITLAGVAVAIWARYCLGQYWSARITLKEDHKLIRSGPYAYVRHPIYTGILLGMAGTALVVGEWRAILAVFLALFTHAEKAKREEALMIATFGSSYEDYRKHTGFLIPRWP